jgi:hypothetical protein
MRVGRFGQWCTIANRQPERANKRYSCSRNVEFEKMNFYQIIFHKTNAMNNDNDAINHLFKPLMALVTYLRFEK